MRKRARGRTEVTAAVSLQLLRRLIQLSFSLDHLCKSSQYFTFPLLCVLLLPAFPQMSSGFIIRPLFFFLFTLCVFQDLEVCSSHTNVPGETLWDRSSPLFTFIFQSSVNSCHIFCSKNLTPLSHPACTFFISCPNFFILNLPFLLLFSLCSSTAGFTTFPFTHIFPVYCKNLSLPRKADNYKKKKKKSLYNFPIDINEFLKLFLVVWFTYGAKKHLAYGVCFNEEHKRKKVESLVHLIHLFVSHRIL